MNNSFGKLFTLTSFGESHGPLIGGVIDGMPAGICLNLEEIQNDLDRRKPGQSRNTSQRREEDTFEIVSGWFEEQTTGTPLAFFIRNQDQKPKDYQSIKDSFRPGHGDFVYKKKYGIRDYRGGGRASARETAIRVAAGAIAKQILAEIADVQISARIKQVGHIQSERDCLQDPAVSDQVDALIKDLRRAGDSIGARIQVCATNVPVGLGEPVYHKLDADLAAAMMGINAVKAVAMGDGLHCVTAKGSEFRDELTTEGFSKNSAGGVLAGISSGQDITMDVLFKPTPSIRLPAQTLTDEGNPTTISTTGRHDPCVGLRAPVIVEAMMALVLVNHLFEYRARSRGEI